MVSRNASLLRVVAAGLALAGANVAWAQLAKNSPFLPPASSAPPAPTTAAPLQFAGYMETQQGVLYRIVDSAKKTGVWVKLNERNPDFGVLAKEYDAGQNSLTVEHEGRPLVLALRESKVISSGSAAQMMAAAPAPLPVNAVPPAVTQPVVVNPTPADEQRRLEAVAAEVARRRALREQAQQPQPGAAQVAIPPPQPQQPVQPNFQPQNARGGRGGIIRPQGR